MRALLRCPKKSSHPLVLDFFDRCATKSSLHPPRRRVGFRARYDRFDNSPNIDFRNCVCVPSCGARKNRRIRWCLIFSTAAPRKPRFIRPRRRIGFRAPCGGLIIVSYFSWIVKTFFRQWQPLPQVWLPQSWSEQSCPSPWS